MKTNTLIRSAAIVAGLAVLAGGALVGLKPAPQPKLVFETVSRGPIASTVVATGAVNPVNTITVGTYVSGVISELSCDYNTRVAKGQLCARIDPKPYQVVVDQDRAAVDTAMAQLAKDEAALGYARLSAERQARLVAEDSTSRDAADLAANAFAQAKAQIALDKATIAQRKAALAAAEVNLGYTRITSPVSGVVVSRNVTAGQTVAASFQTPTLFLIAQDLTKMQVDANVSESDIGSVREGAAAEFTVDAWPRRTFAGRVVQVRQAPVSVQNVITYDVVIAVDNADLALKPGMTATAHIVIAARTSVLKAPSQALRFTPPGAAPREKGVRGLYVERAGKLVFVPVKVGLEDGTAIEVLSGDLREGDRTAVGSANGAKASSAMPRL
jgi:HlyD family secretion protein